MNIPILRINEAIEDIGNLQVAIEPTADPIIGVKVFGWKDDAGASYRALVKNRPGQLSTLQLTGPATAGQGVRFLKVDNAGTVTGAPISSSDLPDNIVLTDGSRPFTAVISGVDPTMVGHLATKGYVDSIVQLWTDQGGYIRSAKNAQVYVSASKTALISTTGLSFADESFYGNFDINGIAIGNPTFGYISQSYSSAEWTDTVGNSIKLITNPAMVSRPTISMLSGGITGTIQFPKGATLQYDFSHSVNIPAGQTYTINGAGIPYNTLTLTPTTLTGEQTGFVNPRGVRISYDGSTRVVSLPVGATAYNKNVPVTVLATAWSSDPHPDTTGEHWLYYDDTGFHWATSFPGVNNLLIACVIRDGVNVCLRECHSVTRTFDWHKGQHDTTGMYKLEAGGDYSQYTLLSTTAANRRPSVSAMVVNDECCVTDIVAWPKTDLYTRAALVGTELEITNDVADIINNNGTRPYYNLNGVSTLFPNNKLGVCLHVAIPATEDAACQKQRLVWVQPQQVFDNNASGLAAAKNISSVSQVDMAQIGDLVPEMVVVGQAIFEYSSSNFFLKEMNKIWGSRFRQVSASSSGGLTSVSTDVTLTGSGTVSDLLSVETSVRSKWTTVGLTKVYRNSYVSINQVADPLAPLHIAGGGGLNRGIRIDNTGATGQYTGIDFYNSSSTTAPIGQFFSMGTTATIGVLTPSSIGLFSEITGPLVLGTLGAGVPIIMCCGATAGEADVVGRFQRSGSNYRAYFAKEQGGAPDALSGHHGIFALSTDSSLRGIDDTGANFLLSAWKIGVNSRTLGLNVTPPANAFSDATHNQQFLSESGSILSSALGTLFQINQNLYLDGNNSSAFFRTRVTGKSSQYVMFDGDHYWYSQPSAVANTQTTSVLKMRLKETGELLLTSTSETIATPSGASALYASNGLLYSVGSNGKKFVVDAWEVSSGSDKVMALSGSSIPTLATNSSFQTSVLGYNFISPSSALIDNSDGSLTRLCHNTYFQSTTGESPVNNWRARVAGASSHLDLNGDRLFFYNAPSVAANGLTTEVVRFGIRADGAVALFDVGFGVTPVVDQGTGTNAIIYSRGGKVYAQDSLGNEFCLT